MRLPTGRFRKKRKVRDDIKSFYVIRYRNGLDNKEQYEENVQSAKERGNYWEVIFKSKGVIPSYSWNVSFLSNGKMIKNQQGWNK